MACQSKVVLPSHIGFQVRVAAVEVRKGGLAAMVAAQACDDAVEVGPKRCGQLVAMGLGVQYRRQTRGNAISRGRRVGLVGLGAERLVGRLRD